VTFFAAGCIRCARLINDVLILLYEAGALVCVKWVMSVSGDQIDLFYQRTLARHASIDEQLQWSALSTSLDTSTIVRLIDDTPEATTYVDPVFRLYLGAFGRVPDWHNPDGPNNFDTGSNSGFWTNVNALRSGIGIVGLAEAFVASNEFHQMYGTTQVVAPLIVAFYQHVLDRSPSSDEVSAWLNTGLDAAHILVGFTESIENKNFQAFFTEGKKEQISTTDAYHPDDDMPLPFDLLHPGHHSAVVGIAETKSDHALG
jgi:hypothetical protein